MTNFITRIELHGAYENDYENLHSQMGARGFARTIKGNDGVTYRLPTAEYYIISNSSLQDVYNAAIAAANATGKSFWAITSEAPSSRFTLVKA